MIFPLKIFTAFKYPLHVSKLAGMPFTINCSYYWRWTLRCEVITGSICAGWVWLWAVEGFTHFPKKAVRRKMLIATCFSRTPLCSGYCSNSWEVINYSAAVITSCNMRAKFDHCWRAFSTQVVNLTMITSHGCRCLSKCNPLWNCNYKKDVFKKPVQDFKFHIGKPSTFVKNYQATHFWIYFHKQLNEISAQLNTPWPGIRLTFHVIQALCPVMVVLILSYNVMPSMSVSHVPALWGAASCWGGGGGE